MRRLVSALAAVVAACLIAPAGAVAKVRIAVDLDAQTIHVESKSATYDWKVSSGKPGYDTPAGTFKVLWMDKDHHSDEYEQAGMPYSIFFAPGFAIHGFSKSPWGHKASHGCVRLPIAKAATLFDLVQAEGGTAEVTITGASNRAAPTVAEVERKRRAADAGSSAAPDDRSYGYEQDYVAPPRRRAAASYANDPYYASPYAAPPQQPMPAGGLFGSFY